MLKNKTVWIDTVKKNKAKVGIFAFIQREDDWKQSRQLNLLSALLLCDGVELVFESKSVEDI